MIDLKGRYQEKAEDMAFSHFGLEFDELPDTLQYLVYEKAMLWVDEDLMNQADNLRKGREIDI